MADESGESEELVEDENDLYQNLDDFLDDVPEDDMVDAELAAGASPAPSPPKGFTNKISWADRTKWTEINFFGLRLTCSQYGRPWRSR